MISSRTVIVTHEASVRGTKRNADSLLVPEGVRATFQGRKVTSAPEDFEVVERTSERGCETLLGQQDKRGHDQVNRLCKARRSEMIDNAICKANILGVVNLCDKQLADFSPLSIATALDQMAQNSWDPSSMKQVQRLISLAQTLISDFEAPTLIKTLSALTELSFQMAVNKRLLEGICSQITSKIETFKVEQLPSIINHLTRLQYPHESCLRAVKNRIFATIEKTPHEIFVELVKNLLELNCSNLLGQGHEIITDRINSNLQNFSSTELSNTIRSLACLPYQDMEVVNRLLEELISKIKELEPLQLVGTLKALSPFHTLHTVRTHLHSWSDPSKFLYHNQEFLSVIADQIADQKSSFDLYQLCQVLYELSQLGCQNQSALEAIFLTLASSIETIETSNLFLIINSLSNLSYRGKGLREIVTAITSKLEIFDSNTVCEIIRLLSKLNYNDRASIDSVATVVAFKIEKFKCNELTAIISALSHLSFDFCHNERCRQIVIARLTSNMQTFTPKEMVNILFVLGKFDYHDVNILESAAVQIASHLEKFEFEQISQLRTSLSKLGFHWSVNERWKQVITHKVTSTTQNFTPSEIVNIIGALLSLGYREQTSLEAIAVKMASLIEKFAKKDFSQLIDHLDQMHFDFLRNERYRQVITHRLISNASDFSPQELSNTIGALKKINYLEEEGLAAMVTAMTSTMERFSPRQLNHIMLALAGLEYRHEAFLEAVSLQVTTKIETFLPRELSNIATAFASLNYHNQPSLEVISARSTALIRLFTCAQLSKLLFALAHFNYSDERCLAAITSSFTSRINDPFLRDEVTSWDCLALIVALGKLNYRDRACLDAVVPLFKLRGMELPCVAIQDVLAAFMALNYFDPSVLQHFQQSILDQFEQAGVDFRTN